VISLELKGKVAVVTGAGRGIGRAVAIALAKEGAKVVVNDLGTSKNGEGQDLSPAQEVVNEIKQNGGDAVANFDSVAGFEQGEKIIQTAIDTFGSIDILVTSAGVLRDRMLFKMSPEEWNIVYETHLLGTFACIRAAAPHMREKQWGRIITFSSPSGLIGNVGQSNYNAAKMGIVGLTRTAALDLARYGVTANTIAPTAMTRMIERPGRVISADELEKHGPERIAPLAVYLASEESENVSGQIFGIRGKEIMVFSQPRPIRSAIAAKEWTADKIHQYMQGPFKAAFTPLEETAVTVYGYDVPE
jgi:NAD(P)-dependent dehydrogenase (short-subunit alcohol dehydrogenase family)